MRGLPPPDGSRTEPGALNKRTWLSSINYYCCAKSTVSSVVPSPRNAHEPRKKASCRPLHRQQPHLFSAHTKPPFPRHTSITEEQNKSHISPLTPDQDYRTHYALMPTTPETPLRTLHRRLARTLDATEAAGQNVRRCERCWMLQDAEQDRT